jgi:hypothetical protein
MFCGDGRGNFDWDQGTLTRGCNDCTVGPVVAEQLRFDGPDDASGIVWDATAEPPVLRMPGGFAV